jgi:apolipoprotein N-acyltransferase
LVALALVAVVVVGARLSPDGSGPGPHTPLRVAVVQGGGPRGLRATSSDPAAVLQRQFDASTSLTPPLSPPLDLVLWPEDVVHVDGPVDQTPEADAVGALAARLHATVVAGVVEEDIAPGRFRNAAVAWSPQGTMVARYDKVHRVPFGEYIPGRSLLRHFVDLGLVSADAIAGHGPGRLVTPAGPLGAVISYEVFYDDRARAAIHAGGQVLLVPSNTSSYRTSQVPTQAVAAARLQALETGRTALYVSPTGYGAIVGPDGRVVARTTLGRAQVLLGSVPPRTGETVYVRFGDRPLLVLLLAGLAIARWPRRRRS